MVKRFRVRRGVAAIFDGVESTGPGYESVKRFESNPSRGMISPRESPRTKGANLVSGGSPFRSLSLSSRRRILAVLFRVASCPGGGLATLRHGGG